MPHGIGTNLGLISLNRAVSSSSSSGVVRAERSDSAFSYASWARFLEDIHSPISLLSCELQPRRLSAHLQLHLEQLETGSLLLQPRFFILRRCMATCPASAFS